MIGISLNCLWIQAKGLLVEKNQKVADDIEVLLGELLEFLWVPDDFVQVGIDLIGVLPSFMRVNDVDNQIKAGSEIGIFVDNLVLLFRNRSENSHVAGCILDAVSNCLLFGWQNHDVVGQNGAEVWGVRVAVVQLLSSAQVLKEKLFFAVVLQLLGQNFLELLHEQI